MSGGRSENIEGAFYVVVDYSTEIVDSGMVNSADWNSNIAEEENVFMFYLVSEKDEIRKATKQEFESKLIEELI